MPRTLITGANSGIGLATAKGLAAEGHDLVLLCRKPDAAEATAAPLRDAHGVDVTCVIADLADYDSVRAAGQALRDDGRGLDTLILNAGLYNPTRRTNAAGHEMTLAVNHLGHFLLTHELLPALNPVQPARIIALSSRSHAEGRLDLHDLHKADKPYSGYAAYSDSKLCNIHFVRELARRLDPTEVVVHAVHPGVIRTGFGQDEPGFFHRLYKLGAPFMASPQSGAQTTLHVATHPDAARTSGDYWAKCKRVRPKPRARNDDDARALWEVSCQMLDLPAWP